MYANACVVDPFWLPLSLQESGGVMPGTQRWVSGLIQVI
jgi:hypothetical protein